MIGLEGRIDLLSADAARKQEHEAEHDDDFHFTYQLIWFVLCTSA